MQGSIGQRAELEKDDKGITLMSKVNLLLLCMKNEQYEQPELNEKLYLHFKGFKKIENLEEYCNLKTLWLENNCLQRIEGIHMLSHLNSIFLQNNFLKDIQGLDSLSQLRVLKLQNNQINKISGLDKLTNLQNLDVSNNNLSDHDSIVHLQECPSLTNVNLSTNQILYDESIQHIFSAMPALACLYLKGNEFVRKFRNYRKTFIVSNKNLKYLDDRPVADDERLCSEAWAKGGLEAEREQRAAINQERRRI